MTDGIDDDIEEVEADVFDDTRAAPTARIYHLKREVIEFHRAVYPLLAPLEALERGVNERYRRSSRATSATSTTTPAGSTSSSAAASC